MIDESQFVTGWCPPETDEACPPGCFQYPTVIPEGKLVASSLERVYRMYEDAHNVQDTEYSILAGWSRNIEVLDGDGNTVVILTAWTFQPWVDYPSSTNQMLYRSATVDGDILYCVYQQRYGGATYGAYLCTYNLLTLSVVSVTLIPGLTSGTVRDMFMYNGKVCIAMDHWGYVYNNSLTLYNILVVNKDATVFGAIGENVSRNRHKLFNNTMIVSADNTTVDYRITDIDGNLILAIPKPYSSGVYGGSPINIINNFGVQYLALKKSDTTVTLYDTTLTEICTMTGGADFGMGISMYGDNIAVGNPTTSWQGIILSGRVDIYNISGTYLKTMPTQVQASTVEQSAYIGGSVMLLRKYLHALVGEFALSTISEHVKYTLDLTSIGE